MNATKKDKAMETTNKEELAIVQRVIDSKYNCIDANGKILLEQWFEWADYFDNGFAKVKRSTDKLWNLIGENGKFLSNEWFKWAEDFKDGFAKVQRTNGDWAKIDINGKIIVSE